MSSLNNTKVSSLEPLRGLTSLQSLNCSYTKVSDLEPLRGLTSLKSLQKNQLTGQLSTAMS